MNGALVLLILIILMISGFYYRESIMDFFSDTRPCPNCDGKGHWYGVRHREDCKACQGSGRLPK